ncbi:hypothetical protein LTR37_017177 [Vermiconidia calcicola]|uniref:Uncharacterized protein n=1 Tax=Vermiconidia calcicola TaxID=1690605 RepID=A0ACC3MLX1_9PEZI|nr:hypothetical protein LTR37_017177 [Vermiconidia calcicola]
MFFKRLSRSRSNSQSYVDSYSPHDSKANSQSYPDDGQRYVSGGSDAVDDRRDLPSSRQSDNQPFASDPLLAKETGGSMYPRQNAPTEVQSGMYNSPPMSAAAPRATNGYGSSGNMSGGYDRGVSSSQKGDSNAAPENLLMQAFNQALRPHMDKVDSLEREIADLQAYVDQLEQQRSDVHAWIDKRGLRPDVPPSIAQQMDATSHSTSSTHAASTLNAQLDRKITIVNFDLHRLQDDLNDSLPTPSFSACMLKFLPDISRLSNLPSGPRYAFDLLLKLGGNLNSHGGLENGDEEDLAERRAFYGRLDEAMVAVVRGRFKEEGDSWGVQREIKRIEKTGAYLRNWGVEPYFPHTLDVMRGESGGGQVNAGATSPNNYA